MSMSEFDNLLNGWDNDVSHHEMQDQSLPEDFSMEDIAFAEELESLLALDEEKMPPYFVQTLLDAEDERFQPASRQFEQKTHAEVFRRLKLKRRLFQPYKPSLQMMKDTFSLRRPIVALLTACILFMLMTMVATSTSFASGLNVKQVNLLVAQQQLHFPIFWPDVMPTNYTLNDIYLYQNSSRTWADGPILEMNYDYTARGAPAHGTGQITICEFKPQFKVYQVVQLGSAHLVQIDANGHANAIYVDGQWVHIGRFSHDWIFGTRSELIYEHDGVIFWIVGDQRDGIDQDVLSKIATSLKAFNLNHAEHLGSPLNEVTLPIDDSSLVFADDVIYSDSPAGPVWKTVGNVSTIDSIGSKHLSIEGEMRTR